MFLERSPKTKKIKAKISKWDVIKLEKNFCTSKENINKQKDNVLKWRKYLEML